jgi:hypothetical protein
MVKIIFSDVRKTSDQIVLSSRLNVDLLEKNNSLNELTPPLRKSLLGHETFAFHLGNLLVGGFHIKPQDCEGIVRAIGDKQDRFSRDSVQFPNESPPNCEFRQIELMIQILRAAL